METTKFNRTFCLGYGVEVKAIKAVIFPATLGGVKVVRGYIKADIIKKDLSQLLSHSKSKVGNRSRG